MKYVVADSKGRIVKSGAHRSSEAINWARARVQGETSVRKVPEIIKVVGANEDDFLLVADEETAKQNGWGDRRRA